MGVKKSTAVATAKRKPDCAPLGLLGQPAEIKRKLVWGKEFPTQLEIRGGMLVMIGTGKTPTFDIPDGTQVNLVTHDDIVRFTDELQLLRHMAA